MALAHCLELGGYWSCIAPPGPPPLPNPPTLHPPEELLHSCAPSAWNDERCVADDLIKVEHLHAYRLQSSGQFGSLGWPVHRGRRRMLAGLLQCLGT